MVGTVKSYNYKRGYGFIAADDGGEYFVHQSQLQMEGFRMLRRGQKVSFDTSGEEGRTAAVNVTVITAE